MQKSGFFGRIAVASIAAATMALSASAWSQSSGTFQAQPPNAPLTAEQLDDLVGPIALYPDDLISIVLPAATYPLQIVQASRFLDAVANDTSLQPDPGWDSSVVALLNYPEVLRMLDTNIEWTWALGEAVLDEQAAVMDAIQIFRNQAMLAGNLTSDNRQSVSQNGNLIEIAPADPEVIYIPYYEPERVVVVQPRPVVHFYADPYPLYYYPYPYGYRFRTGFFWGVTTAFHIGWRSHVLNVFHHHHHLHPFYGRTYYTPFYARRGVNININLNRANPVWRPRQYRAARPHRISNGTRITVNREGSVNSTRTRSTTTRSTNINRSTRVNTPATQNWTTTRTQPTLQNSDRSQVRRQTNTRTERTNRSVAQPQQRSTLPRTTQQRTTQQRSTQQRAVPQRSTSQRSTRQASPGLSPQPRTSNRSTAASAVRQNNTFTSTRQRSSASGGVSRSPSVGASRTRSSTSSRQSGSAGRSSVRSGSATQNGRTRR